MRDLLNQISELANKALAHSIAQVFLIFAGVLVIVSVWKFDGGDLILIKIGFFTLFYAYIIHFITFVL